MSLSRRAFLTGASAAIAAATGQPLPAFGRGSVADVIARMRSNAIQPNSDGNFICVSHPSLADEFREFEVYWQRVMARYARRFGKAWVSPVPPGTMGTWQGINFIDADSE